MQFSGVVAKNWVGPLAFVDSRPTIFLVDGAIDCRVF